MNRLGVELAREAAGPHRFVIGSIGPVSADHADRNTRKQAAILVEAGVDALILETHTVDQAERALGPPTPSSRVPIFACLWTWPDDATSAARRLQDAGADAIGTNCGDGLDDVLAATRRIAGAITVPLIAKPSADFRGRVASPASFARTVPQIGRPGRASDRRMLRFGGGAHRGDARSAEYAGDGESWRVANDTHEVASGGGSASNSPASTLAARLADPPASRTLQLGSDLDQRPAAGRTRGTRRPGRIGDSRRICGFLRR